MKEQPNYATTRSLQPLPVAQWPLFKTKSSASVAADRGQAAGPTWRQVERPGITEGVREQTYKILLQIVHHNVAKYEQHNVEQCRTRVPITSINRLQKRRAYTKQTRILDTLEETARPCCTKTMEYKYDQILC